MTLSDLSRAQTNEWLETDGLGGFASVTATGIRTQRGAYHQGTGVPWLMDAPAFLKL